MAQDSNRGGAFGWLVLGVLLGVAGTLGVEALMHGVGRHRDAAAPEASSGQVGIAAAPPETPETPPAPSSRKLETLSAAASAAAPVAAGGGSQPSPEVAEDAAATGMTSRVGASSAAPADGN